MGLSRTIIRWMLALTLVLLVAPASNPRAAAAASPQGIFVLPLVPVAVAPNQPQVTSDSTRGIINALCEVTLNLLGCGFMPTSAAISCDTNGDGVPELQIPLKDITAVNRLLVQATVPALSPQLPGTPFPLSCCGGTASITLSRTVGPGDNNSIGGFTQSVTCPIDLGLRAPVVLSVTPSNGNCSNAQDLLIPGSCFFQPDGTPNVTSVFAVERSNPMNVVQATRFVILNTNLIDAIFDFGAANAGKAFLIFVSGPNGTSRNLVSLPEGAPEGCPLGNEQGVQVAFVCDPSPPPASGGTSDTPILPFVSSCELKRSGSGVFSMTLNVANVLEGATVTIGGAVPKKVKFRDPAVSGSLTFYSKIVLKGRVCSNLPGAVIIRNPDPLQGSSQPFQCNQRCSN